MLLKKSKLAEKLEKSGKYPDTEIRCRIGDFMKSKIIFILLILFSTMFINAQHKVYINKAGVYIVNNGVINEINTNYIIAGSSIFDNYVVFYGRDIDTCCVYNITTGAISDSISGMVINVVNTEKLIVYSYNLNRENKWEYWQFELEPTTLLAKNITQLYSKPFLAELNQLGVSSYVYYSYHLQRTKKVYIYDRLYRYIGENYYLDIEYGNNIDLSLDYFYYPVSGGTNNIFIIIIYKLPLGKE